MKKIINNKHNLSDEQIDINTSKVRALIIDNNNKVILTKYADMYMLPGGKIDFNEKNIDALCRELKE